MSYTKTTIRAFFLASLFCAGWATVSNDAAAAEIKWQKYMRSSANVSAIAAAVAMVDHCSKKLGIEETISERKIRLDFICDGTEDEEGTASIEFSRFGDDGLISSEFFFAG
jgi:hypothetical protein